MKQHKKYQGVIVPTITPLRENLQLDTEAVEKIFNHLRRHEAMPFIMGTTGEAASLPLNLKKEFIQLAGKLKQPGDMLYSGIASNCLTESVDLAKYCFDAGVDVVAAHLPSYYPLTENQVKKYYEQLANQIPGPLIIYNIPATTHYSIPPQLIEELSYHENIVGTKDSERNEARLQESLTLWANRQDFSHFLGWIGQSAEALFNGSDGLVPSTGNLHPRLYRQMVQAVQSGNREEAFALQKLSDRMGDLYQSGRTLGESLWALKTLMQEVNLCQPYMMPPLQPLSGQEADQLRQNFYALLTEEEMNIQTLQVHV
ncbi:dihydrodipicolinate synthase family protein [Adhaeribacter rhizoryzae]|uniref:Dihydrodipicolinate synthase family protein n=1 Tax=Adhaeribacter rhizoryzae TaxID=2607907 RepID=A0A5M6D090_9BACT|nr:dihydrodipicolinate synthase family protein [Adhaeribacter rhizoryzae]KAA5540891.1 dihydrodipicolinate synthase family protein [Adhaeribacter rhizoryzae]